MMDMIETFIPDVKIFQPKVYKDERGFFFESYNQKNLEEILDFPINFVQDNHSRSNKNVLRGLHFQLPPCSQGKLIRVVSGTVYDIAVDLRESSPTFGKWVGMLLSADVHQMVWIPEGFAHGFLVLSDTADFVYKTTNFYDASLERCIRWDDPDLAIEWPNIAPPLLSPKDRIGSDFKSVEKFP